MPQQADGQLGWVHKLCDFDHITTFIELNDRSSTATSRLDFGMFKFLKDIVSSIKESAAEGVAEFESEEAVRKNKKLAALQRRNAPLLARLSNASALESFAVALAAPHRQTFCRDLYEARKDGRPAVYLLCTDIPPGEVTTWKNLLMRDFSVDDAESAQQQFSSMVEILDKFADDDALALFLLCHKRSRRFMELQCGQCPRAIARATRSCKRGVVIEFAT